MRSRPLFSKTMTTTRPIRGTAGSARPDPYAAAAPQRTGVAGFLGKLAEVVDIVLGARHERRAHPLRDRLLRDHALGDVLSRRQLEHHVEQRRLDDRAQAAGAGLALERTVADL